MSQNHLWSVELNLDWCKGCYLCLEVCPIAGIFTKSAQLGDKGFYRVEVRPEGCTGCRLCELLCPDLAIVVAESQ